MVKKMLNGFIGIFLAVLIVWGIYDHTKKQSDASEKTLTDLKGNRVLLNFCATWCPPFSY
ncbi:TlpA family protein disulfide reductase [Paenibacillus peoriae]|uniref:TlpA family protein disulfide reductase n=1 Tax=Paenibacillus peoriae TaxID=59893 RepID=UPI003F994942